MNIAIIPARAGSQRIPNKNIKLFYGKPIISYSIAAAQASQLFDRIIVSTDSAEIADVALSFGAEVPFMRSAKNSTNMATTFDVLDEVLETLNTRNEAKFTNLCCIYPTAPFLTSEILCDSFKVFIAGTFSTLLPIVEFEFPVFRSVVVNIDGVLEWLYPEFANSRSQDLQKVYHDVGQFYWMTKSHVLESKNILSSKSGSYVMDPMLVQDIDTLNDWQFAELKYEFMRRKNLNV